MTGIFKPKMRISYDQWILFGDRSYRQLTAINPLLTEVKKMKNSSESHFLPFNFGQMIFSVLICLFLFINCDNSKKDWLTVKGENTIKGYAGYLDKHPRSQFADSAKTILENLYYQSALDSNTVVAYSTFIKRYPSSQYIDTIKTRYIGISYKNTLDTNTISAYEHFIKTFPESDKSKELKFRLDNLPFVESVKVIKGSPNNCRFTYSISVLHKKGANIDISLGMIQCGPMYAVPWGSPDIESNKVNENNTKFIVTVESTICGESCRIEIEIFENGKKIKVIKEKFFS
jgi:hypothetical protein